MTPIVDVEKGDLRLDGRPSNSPGVLTEDTVPHRESSSDNQSSTTDGATVEPEKSPLARFVAHGIRYKNGRNERSRHPDGWPSYAYHRDRFNNLCIYRDFSYISWRLLIHQECVLAMLEDELSDFDRQWTKHLKNPPGHCPEYEALLRRMDEEHKKYGESSSTTTTTVNQMSANIHRQLADLIARMQQLRQGGEVSLEVPMDLLRDMYEEEDLEKGIACGMKALEEFRSFEPAESTWIVWLVRTPFGRWLTRQRSGDPDPRGYPAQDLARLLHFIHVAVAMPLLLVPFAILFLDDLPKDEAFGVIVCSMVVACGILSAISRAKNRLMNIFVVGCAYMAFLAAFAAARYFGVGCDLRGV